MNYFDCVTDTDGNPLLRGDMTPAEKKLFFKFFFERPTGQRLLREVGVDPETQQLIDQYANRLMARTKANRISLPDLETLVGQLLDTHAFAPQQPQESVEEEEDTRPRDPQTGKYLSEFEIWANAPGRSMTEIRRRASEDHNFGDWFRRTCQNQSLVEGPFKIAGAPSREATPLERAELEAFASAFQTSSMDQLKPRAGYVFCGKKYPYEEFLALVNRCAAINLIA